MRIALPLIVLTLAGCASDPLRGVRCEHDDEGLAVRLEVESEAGRAPLVELRGAEGVTRIDVVPVAGSPDVIAVRWPTAEGPREVLFSFGRTGPWDFDFALLRPHGDPSAKAHQPRERSGGRADLGTCVIHAYSAGAIGSGGQAAWRFRLERDGALTQVNATTQQAVQGELRPLPDEQISPPKLGS